MTFDNYEHCHALTQKEYSEFIDLWTAYKVEKGQFTKEHLHFIIDCLARIAEERLVTIAELNAELLSNA